MQRKKFDTKKYILVFIITTLIFTTGIIIGSWTSNNKLIDLQELQEDLRSETLDTEVQYSIIEQNPCEYINTTTITEQLNDIALKLDYMENILGSNDKRVIDLKKYYSLLEIRQWLFHQKVNLECKDKKDLILYFYSNKKGTCDDCEEQGFILSYLRKKYSNILIYSFDFDLESHALDSLKKQYEITTIPTLIINENKYEGFLSTADIEEYINNQDIGVSSEVIELKKDQ